MLVVEPSRLLGSAVSQICKRREVAVRLCGDAADALAAVTKLKPTAVVTSFELPGLSGASLIAALKDENRYVRWEVAEALRTVAPGVADTAVTESLSDRPSSSNAKGDRLTLLSIDPPLPAQLESNEAITVRCSFHLQSAPRCYIWVQPYTDGQRSLAGTSGSASYRKGEGEKEGTIHGRDGVTVDQIRIALTYDTSSNRPEVELVVDVDVEWENAEDVQLDVP